MERLNYHNPTRERTGETPMEQTTKDTFQITPKSLQRLGIGQDDAMEYISRTRASRHLNFIQAASTEQLERYIKEVEAWGDKSEAVNEYINAVYAYIYSKKEEAI